MIRADRSWHRHATFTALLAHPRLCGYLTPPDPYLSV